MKKILIILFSIVAFSSFAIGQTTGTSAPKQITISGYVPDSCIKTMSENLDIFFHDNFNDLLWHEGQIFPVKIINNRFSVTIQPKGEIAYFQLRAGSESIALLQSLQMDAFLVNAGDNISINFETSNVANFSGVGSEKLSFQQYAGNLSFSWGSIKAVWNDKPELVNYWKNLTVEHLRLSMDSLRKIRSTLSENTYKVLLFNTSSNIMQIHLDHLSTLSHHITDSLYRNAVKNELSYIDAFQRGFISTDSVILHHSSGYISYLAKFQLLYDRVFSNEATLSFTNTFNKITRDYSGVIRDKILAYLICGYYGSDGMAEFLTKTLSFVKDPESKMLLEKIKNTKTPGAEVDNYSFEDVNGKLLKLHELKGKVVLIEAWFNGCSGCVGLSTRMRPVIEHFKNNKNVVFISLSVDRDKKRFLEGVKQGKYGSKNSVYLYTNGKGWEHPICLKYQWDGYPNMLIIDKNGKIITANKIDPINEAKKAELITLINKHI